MRVAFVQNLWEELPGPVLLAEILERAGHEVRFFLAGRGFWRGLAGFRPEVLALSAVTGNHHWLLDFACRAKERLPGPPLTVMGGAHATFHPKVIDSPGVDAVCRGEGDIAFPRFLAGLSGGRMPEDTPNFWVKTPAGVVRNAPGLLVPDLDALPLPRRSALYREHPFIRSSPFKKIVASRGCPFSCHFCHNAAYRKLVRGKGRFLRRRSVAHVLEEAAFLAACPGTKFIDFHDDVFTLDRDWALTFAQAYGRRVGLPYGINVHASHMDPGLAEALARSGCRSAAFGVEHGDAALRREVLGKTVTDEELLECGRVLRKSGIWFRTYNIMGLPGETLGDAMKTVAFNQRIRPDYAWCTLALPLPGTRFAEIVAEKTGLSPEEAVENLSESWFSRSVVPGPDAARLGNLQKFFGLLVRRPGLSPLIRRLVDLPANPVFRAFFQAHYGLSMLRRTRMGFPRLLRSYFKVRRHY